MIVVHAGQTIAAWRKANYPEQPEYERFGISWRNR